MSSGRLRPNLGRESCWRYVCNNAVNQTTVHAVPFRAMPLTWSRQTSTVLSTCPKNRHHPGSPFVIQECFPGLQSLSPRCRTLLETRRMTACSTRAMCWSYAGETRGECTLMHRNLYSSIAATRWGERRGPAFNDTGRTGYN